MSRNLLKVAVATGLFAVVHSALASRAAKQAFRVACGQRNRAGLYRVFFIAQSLATFSLLAASIRQQPSRELYHVRGPLAWMMHSGQLAALGYATMAAHQVGLRRITGLDSLLAWLGDGPVPVEPEAQGPALDRPGQAHVAGPFAWSRHPLNFAFVPIFWLWPRMTTNLLTFNVVATAYLVIGSLHEEARLRQAYGEKYQAYQQSGVPFYVPWPVGKALAPVSQLLESTPAEAPTAFSPAVPTSPEQDDVAGR